MNGLINALELSRQKDREYLLSLDPKNPDHIIAYAEAQGGITIEIARKMLKMHQEDIKNILSGIAEDPDIMI